MRTSPQGPDGTIRHAMNHRESVKRAGWGDASSLQPRTNSRAYPDFERRPQIPDQHARITNLGG